MSACRSGAEIETRFSEDLLLGGNSKVNAPRKCIGWDVDREGFRISDYCFLDRQKLVWRGQKGG